MHLSEQYQFIFSNASLFQTLLHLLTYQSQNSPLGKGKIDAVLPTLRTRKLTSGKEAK